MEKEASFVKIALDGVERMRQKDHDVRGRVASLLFLLRGAYYTGEGKWRTLAEEDLRALWRGGIHDHIGGGFFSASIDREWLRPSFEKRLDDNAVLAFLFVEAWEKGHMPFYRDAAEESLDFCLRELSGAAGLYTAGLCAAHPDGEDNPFLFTPAEIAGILGDDEGRHFSECYDITAEGNCGAKSIPNLILNQRWNLVPESWDNLRERILLSRELRGGVLKDPRTPLSANALLLAALAKAGRVFSDRRYIAVAEELSEAVCTETTDAPLDRAALIFALTELYAADYDPARISAAAKLASTPVAAKRRKDKSLSAEEDRTLSLEALGFDALLRLTGEKHWNEMRGAALRELCLHPERHGPESLCGLCALLAAGHAQRTILCACPGEEAPASIGLLTARYAPDLTVLLKTPARADALAVAAPWSAALTIGAEPLFYPFEDGKTGTPAGL